MCGRYVTPDSQTIQNWWQSELSAFQSFPFKFNAAPTTQVPIIHTGEKGDVILDEARWGLIPHWWKESNFPSYTFNARSEEAHIKPMWREAYSHSRCIMPAAGWYEWQTQKVVDDKTGKTMEVKQPHYFYHESQSVIGIAGLVSVFITPENGPITTCALLTKAASPELMGIHDRMPVILSRLKCNEWLKLDLPKKEVAELIAGSESEFSHHAVSKSVNNARNDDNGLIASI